MKIIHFSDSHAGAPPTGWKAFTDKRIAGTLNYLLFRKKQHNQEILRELCTRILDLKPDLVVCTGDITSTGQPKEFQTALEFLAPLIGNPSFRFLYVPGNHDKYVNDGECGEALHSAFAKINGENLNLDDMPLKIRIEDCEFILVDETTPTNIFSSCGYLDEKSSYAIEGWCHEKNGLPKILVGHFPLIDPHPILRLRKRLWGQRKIVKCLSEGLLDLCLCGHIHEPYMDVDARGRGVVCAGSVTKSHSFTMIEHSPDNGNFTFHEIRI